MKNFIIRYLPAFLWEALIFIFSSIPVSNPIDFVPQRLLGIFWDTIIFGKRLYFYMVDFGHFIEFAVLASVLARAFVWKGSLTRKSLILAFAFACLYGLPDEIHQIFPPTAPSKF